MMSLDSSSERLDYFVKYVDVLVIVWRWTWDGGLSYIAKREAGSKIWFSSSLGRLGDAPFAFSCYRHCGECFVKER